MDQIAEAIWRFGCEHFGADRRGARRLDRSVVSVVSNEPSETRESLRAEEEDAFSWRYRTPFLKSALHIVCVPKQKGGFPFPNVT